jgi:hypothetical protein
VRIHHHAEDPEIRLARPRSRVVGSMQIDYEDAQAEHHVIIARLCFLK